MSVAARLEEVRRRVDRACAAAGRKSSDVQLVAVSKRHPASAVVEAYEAGQRDFGENLAQELVGKAAEVAARGCQVRWHYLGRVQRNKVNALLRVPVACFHSIDRLDVAQAVSERVHGAPVDVLVQVNIGREPQKGGVAPEEALELAAEVAVLPGLCLRGLMAIPPVDCPPEPHFDALAGLSAQLTATAAGRAATALSMGMTGDFEAAIARGATMIRIGTAIFGERIA